MKYYIYTRCSTEEQKKKGYSHDYQISGIRNHTRLKGHQELAVYSDTISGTTFDRPQLDMISLLCKKNRGHVDMIWIYRWDRFGRDVEEALRTIRLFKDVGVEVNCVDNYIDFNDPNWPVLLNVTLGIAQAESLKISDRTRDGQYQALIKGNYIYSLPTGYKRVNKVIVLDPPVSDYIPNWFQKLTEGYMMSQMFKLEAVQLGISRSKFYRIFKTKFYTGYYDVKAYKRYNACEIKGVHPALITMETFDLAQSVMSSHSRYTIRNTDAMSFFFMRGSIYCNQSDKPMTAYWSTGKMNKKYGYYQAKKHKGNICNASKVHQSVENVIKMMQLQFTPEQEAITLRVLNSYQESKLAKLNAAKKERSKILKNIEKVERDYYAGHLEAIVFTSMHNKLIATKDTIEEKLITLEAEFATNSEDQLQMFEHLKSLHKLYLKSNDYGRSLMIKVLFPEGVWFDKSDYAVRTPLLNVFVEQMLINTGVSAVLKKRDGTKYVPSLSVGGQQSIVRTHYQLFKLLVS